MPKPPFSAYLGLRGSVSERICTNSPRPVTTEQSKSQSIERKISNGLPVPQFMSNFVSTVDTTSIYENEKEMDAECDKNRVFHVLKTQSPRIVDYTSPEMLPPHMIELKVNLKI